MVADSGSLVADSGSLVADSASLVADSGLLVADSRAWWLKPGFPRFQGLVLLPPLSGSLKSSSGVRGKDGFGMGSLYSVSLDGRLEDKALRQSLKPTPLEVQASVLELTTQVIQVHARCALQCGKLLKAHGWRSVAMDAESLDARQVSVLQTYPEVRCLQSQDVNFQLHCCKTHPSENFAGILMLMACLSETISACSSVTTCHILESFKANVLKHALAETLCAFSFNVYVRWAKLKDLLQPIRPCIEGVHILSSPLFASSETTVGAGIQSARDN